MNAILEILATFGFILYLISIIPLGLSATTKKKKLTIIFLISFLLGPILILLSHLIGKYNGYTIRSVSTHTLILLVSILIPFTLMCIGIKKSGLLDSNDEDII